MIETGERELSNPEGEHMLECFELEPDIGPASAQGGIDDVCIDSKRMLVDAMRQQAAHDSAIDEEHARIAGMVYADTLPT